MGRPGQPCCDRVEKDRGQHGRREARLTHRFTSGPSLLARLISRWRFRNVSTRWFRWENAATGVAGDAGCKVLRLKADGSTREEEERSSKGGSQRGGPCRFWTSATRDACHPPGPSLVTLPPGKRHPLLRGKLLSCVPVFKLPCFHCPIKRFFETLPLLFKAMVSNRARQPDASTLQSIAGGRDAWRDVRPACPRASRNATFGPVIHPNPALA